MKLCLQIKASLESCTKLAAKGEDFRWYLKLKCLNCGEVSDKWVYVSLEEKVPMKGGRGEANLVTKCKLCSRENSIDILQETLTSYDSDDSDSFKTIVAFDCRGVEAVDFDPRIGWEIKGLESNTRFEDVNLGEKEWVDYDERAKLSVGVYELQHRFVKS